SGTTVWSQDALRARKLTAPVPFEGMIVVGDFEGYLHFLDTASGEMLARVSHGGEPLRVAPVVAGGPLLGLSDDGKLAAWRLAEESWVPGRPVRGLSSSATVGQPEASRSRTAWPAERRQVQA